MSERLSFDDLTRLRELAVANGDEYLLAAADEALAKGADLARRAARITELELDLRESKQREEWLKEVFIKPGAEARQDFWVRVSRVNQLIDAPGNPAEKLDQIRTILNGWDDPSHPDYDGSADGLASTPDH